MTDEQIREAIAVAPKGANIKGVWERPMHLRKQYRGIPLTKRTDAVVRLISYDHKQVVIEKRENGELPAENAGLRGMEWVWHPYLLQSIKTGKEYIRLERGTNKDAKPKVVYLLDGQKQTEEQIAHMVLASELKSSKSDTFNVSVESMIQLGHYNVIDENEEMGDVEYA